MRVVATLVLIWGLAGCAYLTPPQEYDNNEYELLARIETHVTMIRMNCDDPQFVESRLPDLEFDARLLHSYTFHIPRNTEVFQMAEILKGDALQLKAQYEKGKATPTYCRLKTKLFVEKVRRALEAVAKKTRG